MGLVAIHPTTRGSPLQSTNCVSSLVTSCLTPYLNNAVVSSHCEVLPVSLPYQAFFSHCVLPSCYDHCACLLTLALQITASTLFALLDWLSDCLLPPVPPTTILPGVLDLLLCVNKLPAFGSTLSPCHHLRLSHSIIWVFYYEVTGIMSCAFICIQCKRNWGVNTTLWNCCTCPSNLWYTVVNLDLLPSIS